MIWVGRCFGFEEGKWATNERACSQVDVCKEQVEWAKAEKRAFLRQRIELRLAGLYLETKNYQEALTLIGT